MRLLVLISTKLEVAGKQVLLPYLSDPFGRVQGAGGRDAESASKRQSRRWNEEVNQICFISIWGATVPEKTKHNSRDIFDVFSCVRACTPWYFRLFSV